MYQRSPSPAHCQSHFGNTFPDQQDVQILAATKHGVKPVQNRLEAENSKGKLVYVGSNPFFYVDKLNNSIPYLVPRASVLLQDIGRAYFDSLQIKGIPLHKIIVTSILRTKDDVAKLRTRTVMLPKIRAIFMVLPSISATTATSRFRPVNSLPPGAE